MPAVGTSTMGNAAGVLQYCVKNNYLAGGDAGAVKDRLLGPGHRPETSSRPATPTAPRACCRAATAASLNLKGISSKLKDKGVRLRADRPVAVVTATARAHAS